MRKPVRTGYRSLVDASVDHVREVLNRLDDPAIEVEVETSISIDGQLEFEQGSALDFLAGANVTSVPGSPSGEAAGGIERKREVSGTVHLKAAFRTRAGRGSGQ